MSGPRKWQQELEYGDENIAILHLRHPDGRVGIHWFSTRMWDQVAALNWCESPQGYAYARLPGMTTRLHWLAVGKKAGNGRSMNVDHINGNNRDSRDTNLRIVSKRGNSHNPNNVNRSVSGLCVIRRGTSYRVRVMFSGIHIYQPSFKSVTDAETCRDMYLAIAELFDAGKRPAPTKNELKSVADKISKIVEHDQQHTIMHPSIVAQL